MKEYLFLFRGGYQPGTQPSSDQMQQWVEWMGDLQVRGQLIHAQPLDKTGKQIRGSENFISEGPFDSGDEMVEGFLLCHADNYEMAVEIARGCPVLQNEDGTVEIRQVLEIKL